MKNFESRYRTMTTKRLFAIYLNEFDRKNKADAEITQNLIKKELQRRFNATLNILDDVEQSRNAISVLNYLLGE